MVKPHFSRRTLPFVLFLVCVLAFGLLIPWLGFYQDDWYQVWFSRAFGDRVFVGYYSGERPFIAAIYMLTMPVMGTSPLRWQVFGLLSRFLAALSVYWFLKLVWRDRSSQAAWVALLFAVYPAFRIQYASVIYSHYFIQMAIQMLSLGSMVAAIRNPRRFWLLTVFSLACGTFSLFTSEYFFGLELLRPVFIWISLAQQGVPLWRQRLWRLAKIWFPYVVVLLAFLYWRVFIFRFPTYQPIIFQETQGNYLSLFLMLSRTILQNIIDVGLLTWGRTLRIFGNINTEPFLSIAALGLASVSILLLVIYLVRLGNDPAGTRSPREIDKRDALDWVWIGLIALLGAGLPFWFVGLPVDTDINSGSRFTISFMFGASLLLVGLLDFALRKYWIKAVLVAVIAGLAIGHHFTDANYYRQVHRSQAEFFQQLAWRAPGLKEGTLILTNNFQKDLLSGDNSMTAALNWIYEPNPPYTLDYLLFYLPSRLESGNLTGLKPNLPVVKDFRTANFVGSTSQALAVYYDYPHCLRVLDPELDPELPKPMDMPKELKTAARISNLKQIIPNANPPAQLPEEVFEYIPEENSWCYYYEKAELARQKGDWQDITRLGDQAFIKFPKFHSTWDVLPFIEGYARSGDLEQARKLTMQARRVNPEGKAITTELLCFIWSRIEQDPISEEILRSYSANVIGELNCIR
jgi:hypothetical protein